jgi:DNA-binding NtrC family response regulator
MLQKGKGLVIGREAPADFVLDDPTLSRAHARFAWLDDGVSVEDLGSRNGTIVRGERVATALVRTGEEILLGQVLVRVQPTATRDGHGLEGHDAFRATLEREIVRARFFGEVLALFFVRRRDGAHIGTFARGVQQLLRPVDRLAAYSADALEILLPKVGASEAAGLAKALGADRGAGALVCAAAVYPDAAGSCEELIAAGRAALLEASKTSAPVVATGGARVASIEPSAAGPVAASTAMQELFDTVDRLATAVIPVLLWGETGTGKEVIAQAIHRRGPRAGRPLVCVNCGAIPPQLVESTLFGHERGAFTGAHQRQRGVFESADGGTVLLDEIGELPAPAQAALLRVLETRRLTRVGSSDEVAVDVRVIAATHRDLEEMVRAGTFRRDLLYRLNAMIVRIPPLRERVEDIEPLCARFLREASEANQRSVRGVHPAALKSLTRYAWPGNVRELKNAIERAVVISRGDVVTLEDLPEPIRKCDAATATTTATTSSAADLVSNLEDDALDLKTFLQRCEADYLVRALRRADWNQSEAARLLSLPRRTLIHKMQQYGIKKLGFALGDEEDD